jgi:hypothetical protein
MGERGREGEIVRDATGHKKTGESIFTVKVIMIYTWIREPRYYFIKHI